MGNAASPVAAVSSSMAAGLLSVRQGATTLIHLVRLAAVIAMMTGHFMLHIGAMLMHTAMCCLSGTENDMQPGCLGLTVEGEHRYASDNG